MSSGSLENQKGLQTKANEKMEWRSPSRFHSHHEGTASKYWLRETPRQRPWDYLLRNIHQGQGDKKYCSKVVWMTQMTGWRRKELSSCHLDLSRCELTVDCPLRYQLGIEARSDLTQAKRLGSGERTDFNGISTFNREITPPTPNSTHHNRWFSCNLGRHK